MTTKPEELIDAAALAAKLHVPLLKIQQLTRQRLIPSYRLGRKTIRYEEESCWRALERLKVQEITIRSR